MASAGIPYFPLECQLNEKFQLLEAEFGLKGFAVVVKLYQRIYGSHGYYCEWTTDVELLFSMQIGEGRNSVSEIVGRALERDIFSKPLYDKYQILTSAGIQRRYFEAVSRRKKMEVEEAYLLVPYDVLPGNVDISSKNADISSKNVDIFIQRKEEESKEKKRRGEKRTHAHTLGSFQNVFLSDDEYKKFSEAYENAEDIIESLSNYKKRKSITDNSADYAWLESFAKTDGRRRTTKKKNAYFRCLNEAKAGCPPSKDDDLTAEQFEELSKIAIAALAIDGGPYNGWRIGRDPSGDEKLQAVKGKECITGTAEQIYEEIKKRVLKETATGGENDEKRKNTQGLVHKQGSI